MVDKVSDIGNFVQVDIAIVSEMYCKYRKQRIYNAMTTGSFNNISRDKDF